MRRTISCTKFVGVTCALAALAACATSGAKRATVDSIGRLADDCEAPEAQRPATALTAKVERTDVATATVASEPAEDLATPSLRIFVFPVGQADSVLVVGAGAAPRTLLVDIGERRNGVSLASDTFSLVASRIREILQDNTPSIDYFVASHYHSDHVGNNSSVDGLAGLIEVEGIRVGTIIAAGDEGSVFFHGASRSTFDTFENRVSNWVADGRVARHESARFGTDQIDLGAGVEVSILAVAGRASDADRGALARVESLGTSSPYPAAPPSENDLSIALLISVGNFEFFTAGDLTGATPEDANKLFTVREFSNGGRTTYTNVERHLLSEWRMAGREVDAEIYRANHHGSGHSSSPRFIEALDPEFVIYSTGGGYDHPSRQVVERLGRTARQFVTSGAATSVWGSGSAARRALGQHRAEIVGEVSIEVGASGSWYRIQGEIHRAYSDSEEREGRDRGEENAVW